MFNYEYRSTTTAGRVCLEISLKPFGYDKSDEAFEKIACELFTQWRPLLKYATGCAVLFWTSDGSEILDYTGDPEDSFEWCKYIGIGNWDRQTPPKDRPDRLSLHAFPIHYMENPPEMTYGDLKRIIAAMKKIGKKLTGFDIEVGETFDPGPEFAYSSFKYERHPEISKGNIMGSKLWLHCASRLHADDRHYAAYPDGIPEGTHIGEFLGRQFMAMRRDLGFDYIWLSNGFGFSLASWNWTGELFDGTKFNFDGAEKVRENIAEFWKYFTGAIGDTRVETRGSNLSAGMDISAHGCPIDVIYSQKNLVAPPNSPWAPLNYRFGLELAGFMSHIAELPEKGFNLRYYIHDPWWLNSPWFDRYDRSPHDIYLPLALARLDEKLEVTKPFGLAFLSADDSFGRLPERCPNEVIPHLLTAYNDYPDAPGLVTWVYPFDAYCELGLAEGKLADIFMDDWFVESAVDMGLPINSVISDKNFIAADKSKLTDTILLTPVPKAGSALEDSLFEVMEKGGKVILVGSLRNASEKLRKAAGTGYSSEIDGTLGFSTDLMLDVSETNRYASVISHPPLVSNGGIGEVSDGSTRVTAIVSKDGETRAYMTYNKNLGLVWIRGSFPHDTNPKYPLPIKLAPSRFFPTALLSRAALELFGYPMTFECFNVDDNLPIVQLAKCRSAVIYNLFAKDASIRMRFTTPDGAPAFDNTEFTIENDTGLYPLSRWVHTDCRVFIKQSKKAKICVKRDNPETYLNADELYSIFGLDDATLTIFPPKGGLAWVAKFWGTWKGPAFEAKFDEKRGCYVADHVSGKVSVMIQEKENIGDFRKLEFLRTPDLLPDKDWKFTEKE